MKPALSVIVALLFLAIARINIGFCNGSSYVGCIESERQALLRFKQDLNDSSNRFASWTLHRDCCTWAGVVCDNFTGHVHELHLRNPIIKPTNIPFDPASYSDQYDNYTRSKLVGKVNPSLIDLEHLIYLDLSGNYFEGIHIPKFLGSMRNLRYLNLSDTGFEGLIPPHLGNLSHLQYFDLSQNNMLYVENISWLSRLSLLKHLDLSGVHMNKASNWLLVINSISSLVVLQLSDCELNHLPQLSTANFSSLATLDLSYNQFDNPSMPNWVCGLSHLVFLDLNFGNFYGPIPDGLQNLTFLRHLNLASNAFNYSIPNNWLHKFSHLEYLYLEGNYLQGTIVNVVGNLSSIKILDLSFNDKLEGQIPRSWGTFCKLSSVSLIDIKLSQDISEILNIFSGCVSNKLELLDLTNSQLLGNLSDQLQKFKSLKTLHLNENSVSGHIPFSLGKLSSLISLGLTNNKLDGSLFPSHFVNLTRLMFFYASGNSLTFEVGSNWVPPFQLQDLELRSCHLGPQFPSWLLSQNRLSKLDISNSGISDTIPTKFWSSPSQFYNLNLSHNQIYGVIPNLFKAAPSAMLDLSSNNISGPLPRITFVVFGLDLSNNAFSGAISHFLCYEMNISKQLQILNLENNFLFGELPDCWSDWTNLLVLNLNNNQFTGVLPTSLGNIRSLWSLQLRQNRFSGIIPVSLKSSSQLTTLDIGENEFVGDVPSWIGEAFLRLLYLNLRSNKFHGPLPIELCRLDSLQILDISNNNLFGPIPRCINNLSAMVTMNNSIDFNSIEYVIDSVGFIENAFLVMKGKVVEYNTILNLVRSIDFSQNKFSGEIPVEVTNLKALQSLNLSHNFFTGRIPESIGDMRSLESIDFSANQFSGEIPQSMSSLTFLSHLNLSNNNLIGKIPSSAQLQSLDASSFIGNELCGSPLPKNYSAIVPTPDFESRGAEDSNEHEVDWFYVSMALGFVVGFWSIIGPLVVNRRWRYKYCHFLDCVGEKFGCVVRKCW